MKKNTNKAEATVITYATTEATIRPIVEALERMFDNLNARFFESKLEHPVLTVSPDTTKGAYGWMTTYKAWSTKPGKDGLKDGGYYELNICAEHLQRPLPEVVGTLLHEMVHLHCIMQGIKDTSRNGWYHNDKYKAQAEAHGLVVEKTDKYGYSKTSLSPETLEWLSTITTEETFAIHRKALPKKQQKTKKNHSYKYTCPNCGNSVRATKSVCVACMDCSVQMLLDC